MTAPNENRAKKRTSGRPRMVIDYPVAVVHAAANPAASVVGYEQGKLRTPPGRP
jgi:hypothetical protein